MLALPASYPALAGKIYERYARWLVPLVTSVLAVAIGWTLSQLVWALVPVPESARWRPAPVPVEMTRTVGSSGPNIESIAAAKLFGSYQAPANPDAAALSQAPDTRLNLTLLGILADSDARTSRAMISQQNGDEGAYAIGQDVVAGVSLQAIFPDRVILSRSGVLETLRLDKDAPSKGGVPVVQDADGSNAPAGTTLMLSQIREQILQDPSKAAEFIRVQPATGGSGGGIRGYRIYPGKDRSIFASAGLRPGDLVTAVNGIQLDDGSKALQTLNDLKSAGNITLTLERGGQSQTVNVSLNPQ